jgi:outer membrane receptor protein involved in Fe transport
MKRTTLVGTTCLTFALFSGLASAEAVAATQADTVSTVAEVAVTASRIVRDGYQAPTPTTVVGIEELSKSAPATLADYVNNLPQLGGATSPRTNSFNAVSGAGGANVFNLRNLGSVRTLTLLDGHRVVPASITGQADINLLPMGLVSRVEVVTGGTSAAWGSDAISGVVNFILDRKFTGIRGSIGRGESFRNDGSTFNVDLSAGTRFAGDRGHILVSGSYNDNGPVDKNSSRPWYTGYKAVPNIARTATNGLPGFIAVDNAGLSRATDGGVILAGPLANTQFGPGGQILPYRPATQGSGILGAGGDVLDIGGRYAILPVTSWYSLYGRASYDVTDDVNAYVEVGYGHSEGVNYSSQYIRHANLEIKADNAFIPSGLNMTGVSSFLMGRVQNEIGLTKVYADRDQVRILGGVEGKTAWFNDSFRWDAYYQHGETKLYQAVGNNAIIDNFNKAVDAVRNPAVGGIPGLAVGAPVCRSTLTDRGNGCAPFNVFGPYAASQAAVAYTSGVAYQNVKNQQDVAAAKIQFNPFSLPAGPVSVATGLEWRKEQYYARVDPLDAVTPGAPFWFGNYKPSNGSYTAKEYFGEIIVPILRDLPLIKQIDFNGAARSTNYSTSGRVTTWKAGATWDLTDDIRLRATRSRDIRAPNLSDLFLGAAGAGGGILAPGTNSQVFITSVAGGNRLLVPEIAKTKAYGGVYQPSWLPGFSTSVDYYKIDLGNAIVGVTSQQVVNQCYGVGGPVVPSACLAITLAPDGTLNGALIRTAGANIARQTVAGYDIEATYRKKLADFSDKLAGDLTLRAVGNHISEFTQTVGGIKSNYKGMVTGGILPAASGPEWRWLITSSYALGPSTTTVAMRYISESVVNNEPRGSALAVDKNDIPSVTYFDVTQNWNLRIHGAESVAFVQISNLFDKDPPKVANTSGQAYAASGTEFAFYDAVGRSWRVGIRFKY